MSQEIEIGLIFPSLTARPIDKTKVAALAASIEDVGLINAINVRPVIRHRGTTPFDAYQIVSGHHRYAAALVARSLTVRCEIVEVDDPHAELAEIDENLIRANFTAAQEAAAIARRKVLYEIIHPETKADAFKGNRHTGSLVNEKTAFTISTAEATGKSRRTVEIAAARGKSLGVDAVEVVGTSLDKGAELDALAKMSAAERAPLIERAKGGEKVSAREPAAQQKLRQERKRKKLAAQERWQAQVRAEDTAVRERRTQAALAAVDHLRRTFADEELIEFGRLVTASSGEFAIKLNALVEELAAGAEQQEEAR